MTDNTEVLNFLRLLDAKVEAIHQEQGRALELLRQDVASVRATQSEHTRTLHVLRQDTRMLRAAANDAARDSVTPGEVGVLHEDVSRLQDEMLELSSRLTVIEGRDRH